MSVPDKHRAGDTLEFDVEVPDFPPADGWTLKYRLVARFSTPVQTEILLTGVASSASATAYTVGETATNSATWQAGLYAWSRWVERTVTVYEKHTLDDAESRGEIEMLANMGTAVQPFDNRSQAKKAYDDCQEALAALPALAASSGGRAIELTIGDRTTKYDSQQAASDGLRALANYWWRRMDAEDAIAEGRPVGPLGRVRYAVGSE